MHRIVSPHPQWKHAILKPLTTLYYVWVMFSKLREVLQRTLIHLHRNRTLHPRELNMLLRLGYLCGTCKLAVTSSFITLETDRLVARAISSIRLRVKHRVLKNIAQSLHTTGCLSPTTSQCSLDSLLITSTALIFSEHQNDHIRPLNTKINTVWCQVSLWPQSKLRL